jgi:NAD(P)-dependent dehydrogenase (short-subunit alcohol dehydrogenase family)
MAMTNVLTRSLALELRERDITVNAVSPAVRGPCLPDRVADVIAYLLSDHGHRLTGQVLNVGEAESRP